MATETDKFESLYLAILTALVEVRWIGDIQIRHHYPLPEYAVTVTFKGRSITRNYTILQYVQAGGVGEAVHRIRMDLELVHKELRARADHANRPPEIQWHQEEMPPSAR